MENGVGSYFGVSTVGIFNHFSRRTTSAQFCFAHKQTDTQQIKKRLPSATLRKPNFCALLSFHRPCPDGPNSGWVFHRRHRLHYTHWEYHKLLVLGANLLQTPPDRFHLIHSQQQPGVLGLFFSLFCGCCWRVCIWTLNARQWSTYFTHPAMVLFATSAPAHGERQAGPYAGPFASGSISQRITRTHRHTHNGTTSV